MRILLVFDDWRDASHQSVYCTEKGVELSMGDLHHGSTFLADIQLDEDSSRELETALSEGYIPVFYVSKENPGSMPTPSREGVTRKRRVPETTRSIESILKG